MKPADLQREIAQQKVLIASQRMGVRLQKEKDTAKYQREKKNLARMHTIYTEKRQEELLSTKTESTVPASAPSSAKATAGRSTTSSSS